MVDVEVHISEDELESRIREETDCRIKDRLYFIRNLYDGDGIEHAISKVGYGTTTGYNWLHEWNEHGLEGLQPDFDGGAPPKLSPTDEVRFVRYLAEDDPWTIEGIHDLLTEEFGVTYTERHLRRKLESYGMEFSESRPYDYRWSDVDEDNLDEHLKDALDRIDTFDEAFHHFNTAETNSYWKGER